MLKNLLIVELATEQLKAIELKKERKLQSHERAPTLAIPLKLKKRII